MVKLQFKQLEELIPNDVVSDGGEIDILVGAKTVKGQCN